MNFIWYDYFEWLCGIVHADEQTLYWYDILMHLQRTEFVVKLAMDANRVEDARGLRNEYLELTGLSRGIIEAPISVLEVLIALAHRGEWEIMHDPELGDRTYLWFWTMIYNLGLDKFAYRGALDRPDVDLKVTQILENFMARKYSKDGKGGIFQNKTGQIDMRREELWNQICYYFDQFF